MSDEGTARRPGRGALLLTGAGGGFFSGLTGVGGGAIMVPLLTGLIGMRQHTAHGTSLVVIIFAAAAGAATYAATEGLDTGLVAVLLPGSLLGAYAGARFVQRVPALRLRQGFGVFLLLVGLRLILVHDVTAVVESAGAARLVLASAIGLTGGLVSGALGVGGGAIFVPALVLLLGEPQHGAQGASLCVIVAAAFVGAMTHARHGSLDFAVAKPVAALAVPAGLAGASVASVLDAGVLQRVFAAVVMGVGAQMIFTATRSIRRARAGVRLAGGIPG